VGDAREEPVMETHQKIRWLQVNPPLAGEYPDGNRDCCAPTLASQ